MTTSFSHHISGTSRFPPAPISVGAFGSSGELWSDSSNPTATTPPTTGSIHDLPDGGPAPTSLHLADLDPWMDEAYVRNECCALMGWEGVSGVKIIRNGTSCYAFLTFPTSTQAAAVLERFNSAPPMVMPRTNKTFKLNWGTGLPGLQPRWDSEFSVFVGDLSKDVTEADLVAVFSPLFASTKSAKIMCDPGSGLSRGYGFVRFTQEADMQRALLLGRSGGLSGLSLRGRMLRISEASNSSKQRQGALARGPLAGPLSAPLHAPHGYTDAPAPGPLAPRLSLDNFHNHSSANTNTTVFVGGLPSCISEDTLRSFFIHFGPIVYCKIPHGKGCGFVQYVHRKDAELAILKMDDFPIHGKSRIRLSWGRSQSDKQVESAKKLAGTLGVSFESVWRIVQEEQRSSNLQQDNIHEQILKLISEGGKAGFDAAAYADAAGSAPAQAQSLLHPPTSAAGNYLSSSFPGDSSLMFEPKPAGVPLSNSLQPATHYYPLSPPPSAPATVTSFSVPHQQSFSAYENTPTSPVHDLFPLKSTSPDSTSSDPFAYSSATSNDALNFSLSHLSLDDSATPREERKSLLF